jgi:hypothetical protein
MENGVAGKLKEHRDSAEQAENTELANKLREHGDSAELADKVGEHRESTEHRLEHGEDHSVISRGW